MSNNNDLVFALDIGTRTVIGLVLKKEDNNFKIIDSEVVEHSKRAMLDGQIHNVTEVSKIVKKIKKELENRLDEKLKNVAIAAAGRALETITTEYEFDYKQRKYIEKEDVQELEYACIQKAQNILAKSNGENNAGDYHFVGYSVMSYNLDSMFIKDLVGQKGRKIKVKLIATFLPQVVIDSLLSVIQRADLEVDYLTLEPIAASKMVIPEEMYNFNLVLIDIGAGTSDIAITKSGSMIGYAMVPVAGDEITEKISEKYMLEYNKAEIAKRSLVEKEEYKTSTILGNEIVVEKDETLDFIKPQIKEMVELIINKVIEINENLPKAVMCIGGGSLTPLLKEELVKAFDLPESRIGIRDGSNLDNIIGQIKNISGPQSLTPIGIAVSAFDNSSETVFANVEVNGQNIQVFSLNSPSISDALLSAEIDINKLKAKVGKGLTCTVNGELKTIKGDLGKSGEVLLNGEKANLEDKITSGDTINFKTGKKGKDAEGKIRNVVEKEAKKKYKININNNETSVSTKIYQNKKLVTLDSEIIDGADIEYDKIITIKDALASILEVSKTKISEKSKEIILNGEKKKIPKKDYFAKVKNKDININHKMEDDLKILLIKKSKDIATVNDLLKAEVKDKEKMQIVFNGSNLEIPSSDKLIKVNGKKVDKNYELEDGDKITTEMKSMTVNQLFNYINYNISESMKNDMEIIINDELGGYDDLISSGDNIKMKLKRK